MGYYHTIWLQVMWAIGLCMLALALLIKLATQPIAGAWFSYCIWSQLTDPNQLSRAMSLATRCGRFCMTEAIYHKVV